MNVTSFLMVLAMAAGGPAEVRRTCTRCHGINVVEAQRLSRAEWERELEKMERMGAEIPDWDRMLNYLARTYGRSRKKAVK